MALISAVSMTSPIKTLKTQTTFLGPLPIKPNKPSPFIMGQKPSDPRGSTRVKASLEEKVVTGLTATALTASMVVPEVAKAAELTPSLKNFFLSVVAGGVVLLVLFGAVIAVANFDPVKRV